MRVARLFTYPHRAGQTALPQHIHSVPKEDREDRHQPIPVYPELAKVAHVSGVVELLASVSTTGNVVHIQVLSGPAMLIGAAVDAVHGWTYPASQTNGIPVGSYAIIDIHFNILSNPN